MSTDYASRSCAFSEAQYALIGTTADGNGGGVLAWARDIGHAGRIAKRLHALGDVFKIYSAPGGDIQEAAAVALSRSFVHSLGFDPNKGSTSGSRP